MVSLSDNIVMASSDLENEDEFSSKDFKISVDLQNELGGGEGGGDEEGGGEEERGMEEEGGGGREGGGDTSRVQGGSSFFGGTNEEDSAILVLDPDHPKMVVFQEAVKKYLLKMKEKYTMAIREVDKPMIVKKQEKENLGVDLYGVQQELARQQMLLEEQQDKYINENNERVKEETELDTRKKKYSKLINEYQHTKNHATHLRNEIENLGLRRFYMRDTKDDLTGDIKLMKRAADKAENDVYQSQVEKKKQDFFVDRLVEKVEKLQDDIAMYNAQYKLQVLETKNAKKLLNEAELQLISINMEKRELHQYWRNSLIGMKRRDEAHLSAMTGYRQLQEEEMTLDCEILGCKKSILAEEERNEKLMNIFNKNKKDSDIVKEMLRVCKHKHEILKKQFAKRSRLLHETEQALNKATTKKNSLNESVEEKKKSSVKERNKIKELEAEIMETIHKQLMFEKSAQYTEKLTDKTKDISTQLDFERIMLENLISKIIMECTSAKAKKAQIESIIKQYDEEIAERNVAIDRSEEGILKRASMLERKQTTIDSYNKRLEILISKAGGIELGPLEMKIRSLQKSIREREHDIGQLQQKWLQKQGLLVQLVQERDEQSEAMDITKKELTIHAQKKLRITNKIHKQECEKNDLDRSVANCRRDITKLNELNYKENLLVEDTEQTNLLVENRFLLSLQQAKMDLIELEEKLQNMKNEKENLLQKLVETDQQIMLWERKIQLLKETRAAVDTDFDQGEIRAMKAEIHRMEVRYGQLMRQQNKMITETERFFLRRESIAVRGEARTNKKIFTKGTLNRELIDLKRKIKQASQEAISFNYEIENFQKTQNSLGKKLDNEQDIWSNLKSQLDIINEEYLSKENNKYKNLLFLVIEQQKSKHYQLVKDNKYKFVYKNKLSRYTEFKKQTNQIQTMRAIIDQMKQENPKLQDTVEKMVLVMSAMKSVYMNKEDEEEEDEEDQEEEQEVEVKKEKEKETETSVDEKIEEGETKEEV